MKVRYLVAKLLLLIMLSACGSNTSPLPPPLPTPKPTVETVNIARSAHLTQTISIEITQYSRSATPALSGNPFVPRATLTDTAVIAQFVNTLDQEEEIGPVFACVPEYEFYFHLKSGPIAQFDYLCLGEDSPYFNGGSLSDGSFRLRGGVGLSSRFKDLLDEQLKSIPEPTNTP